MSTVIEEIEILKSNAKSVISKRRKQKIILYCEGLKTKLEQVSYALSSIEEFTNRSDETESTTEEYFFSISMRVAFYCDTFWTFLYSSLDVLSQIVNQAMVLNFDEKDVSFNKVRGKLGADDYKDKEISKKYNKCHNSLAFKGLEKYRNCSIHRRQVYIEEMCQTKRVKGTPGYTSMTSTEDISTVVTRTLCNDPLTPSSKVNPNRKIPDYMVKTQEDIERSIKQILKKIEIKK